MVVKTEHCAFSEYRIYPGHGIKFIKVIIILIIVIIIIVVSSNSDSSNSNNASSSIDRLLINWYYIYVTIVYSFWYIDY